MHRKLGTHITKVKSVNLDGWTQQQLELYKNIGTNLAAYLGVVDNATANEFWEYKLPRGFQRPTETTSPEQVWQFIQNKYVKKCYAPKNAVDPAAEYREHGCVSRGPTEDSVCAHEESQPEPKPKRRTPLKAETRPAPKVDVKELWDLDLAAGSKPAVSQQQSKPIPVPATAEAYKDLWGILEPNNDSNKRPAPQQTEQRRPQPTFGFQAPYNSCPQAGRYAALDQVGTMGCGYWPGFGTNPIYNSPPTTVVAAAKVPEKSAGAFANLLPSDFS